MFTDIRLSSENHHVLDRLRGYPNMKKFPYATCFLATGRMVE